MARIRDSGRGTELEEAEFQKQAQGLRNSQPHIVEDWIPLSRNQIRRQLRENLGKRGDILRRAGWGGMSFGPLTCDVLDRFSRKLAKALFYREVGERFDGVIYARRYSIADGMSFQVLQEILKFAPMGAELFRAKQPLSDQFNYRFNASSSLGVLYAVVEFSPQLIFQISALSRRGLAGLNEYRAGLGQEPLPTDEYGGRLVF